MADPFTEKAPAPPEASVAMVDPRTGRPTVPWLNYFARLKAYLDRLAAALPPP